MAHDIITFVSNPMAQLIGAIAIILVGGTAIYWISYRSNPTGTGHWVLPYLFGFTVGGAVLAWLAIDDMHVRSRIIAWLEIDDVHTWGKIIAVIAGAVAGFMLAVFTFISDPKFDNDDPVLEYLDMMAFLGIPIGLLIGISLGRLWFVPRLIVTICIGPIIGLAVLGAVTSAIQKLRKTPGKTA